MKVGRRFHPALMSALIISGVAIVVGPAGCGGSGGGAADRGCAGSFPGVTETIPLAIFVARESNFDAAVALSVMVLVFALTVILVARFLLGKAAEFASS